MNHSIRCGCTSAVQCAGVEALWQGYLRHRGTDGYDLCRRLGIPIFRARGMDRFRAYLRRERETPRPYSIVLPDVDPTDFSPREGMLIYHEIAHTFLWETKWEIFHDPPTMTSRDSGFHWRVEAWCDNFAMAMLLSMFGMHIPAEEHAHTFLSDGEDLRCQHLQNRRFAARLWLLNSRAPRETRHFRSPLYRLVRQLKLANPAPAP